MKNTYKLLASLKNNSQYLSVLALVVGGFLIASISSSQLLLSKFTASSGITAQNASSLWVGGTDNSFRSKLSPKYVTKLDAIFVAILRKGSTMSNDQFGVYLKNLSRGVIALGNKSNYINDPEVQNILGFLVYEIDSTAISLIKTDDTARLIGDIANIISTEESNVSENVSAIENEAVIQRNSSTVNPPQAVTQEGSSTQATTQTVTQTTAQSSTQTIQDVPVKLTTSIGGVVQADCWSLEKLQLNPTTNANIIGLVQSANTYGNLNFMYCTVNGGQPHFYTAKENRTCLPSGDTACYTAKNITASSEPVCSPGKEIEYYFYYNPGLKEALVGNSPIDHWNNYGLKEGRKSCWTGKINASGQPVVNAPVSNHPTETSQAVAVNSRNKTSFGIFYSGWHCPVVKYTKQYTGSDILYTSDMSTNNINWFHFWGKPKLGHYCLTDREDVLRQHAAWLKDAGIEYIVFDSTNHAYLDNRSSLTSEMVIEPFKKLLEVWSTIPGAPKVVPWVPVVQGGDTYVEMKNILDRYPSMKFNFKGKPLFIVTGDESRFTPDTAAIASLEQTYTVRTMWGLQNGGNLQKWSFLEQNGLNGIRNNEQITVSAAYQQTHITEPTGVGKKNGETFKTQFSTVFANPGVDTVLISSWNEWMGQKFLIDGKITYTDSFDEDRNRDIEPQEGGKGSFYYDLMKKCIASYKIGGNSCE